MSDDTRITDLIRRYGPVVFAENEAGEIVCTIRGRLMPDENGTADAFGESAREALERAANEPSSVTAISDTERLDWLEKLGCFEVELDLLGIYTFPEEADYECGEWDTLRELIDAGMDVSPPGPSV